MKMIDRDWPDAALQVASVGRNADLSVSGFRSLIENATDIIVILDEQGMFRYCSPSAERVLGYRLEDVEGRSVAELVYPEDIEVIWNVLTRAVRQPKVSQPAVEYRVRHQDGSWRFFEAVATSLLDNPAIRGVVVNCHDITDRKQVEEALRAANRQIASILESITDAFVSLDRHCRFAYVNQRATVLLQRSQDQLLGQNLWETFPEFVNSTLEQECHRALTQQIPVSFEEFYPFLNTWFEIRVFPAADGLSIFLVDVTDRRQAQAELMEMSTALGNAVEGIARLDNQGQFIALNRAYAEALGYEQADMVGMGWQRTVLQDDIPLMNAAYQRMLSDGKSEVEVRAVCKDGSVFYQEVMMVGAYDWYDQLTGHHCFTRDITERKSAEETLLRQAERERLMGALAQLSAGIAQRIRQTLNLKEILNTTVSEVRQFLNVDRVVIYRCEPHSNCVVTAESVQTDFPSILGLSLQDRDFAQRAIAYRQGKPLVVVDVAKLQTETGDLQAFLKRWQVSAFLSVPILHGNALWGTLVAYQCNQTRQWEGYEIGLLEQLASQVAIAIQQSELYGQVQQLNANLEVQVQDRTTQLRQALDYEATLKRITDSVRDSLDETQILQNAVQELAMGLDVLGCDAGIYDLDQQTSTIWYEYIRHELPTAKGSKMRMLDSPDLYSQLLRAQYFQFCRNFESDIRPLKREHTAFACPIVDDQGVMGDLWLFKPCTQVFSELDIRLVQQVANQCAIAIRQARLYQATQDQVAALEELNQLKDDFLSTVSHELRTPMSNMKMAIHMLRTMTSPTRQKQYLDILQAECVREIELINDLLDLQRLEASSYVFSLTAIDLQSCVQSLIKPFQTRSSNREQRLSVTLPTNLSTLITDRSTLERVLAELLNNACKYTSPGGEIIFNVEQLEESANHAAQVVFTVQNQAEISAAELSRVFDKFYRVPHGDRWKQGGTGLGLALIQRLVIELGGSITAQSEQGWTTFTVTFSHSSCPLSP
jgi:PAS domain S-box-containing protein